MWMELVVGWFCFVVVWCWLVVGVVVIGGLVGVW